MEWLSRPSFVAAALRWWDLCANSLHSMKYFKRQPHHEARQRVPLHRWHENAWLPQTVHGMDPKGLPVSPPKAQVCSRLRKAKFIAIPLDPGSGGTGPCCCQMGTIGRKWKSTRVRESCPQRGSTTKNNGCKMVQELLTPTHVRHTLVAPWRISLVLKEHRPPMFMAQRISEIARNIMYI